MTEAISRDFNKSYIPLKNVKVLDSTVINFNIQIKFVLSQDCNYLMEPGILK